MNIQQTIQLRCENQIVTSMMNLWQLRQAYYREPDAFLLYYMGALITQNMVHVGVAGTPDLNHWSWCTLYRSYTPAQRGRVVCLLHSSYLGWKQCNLCRGYYYVFLLFRVIFSFSFRLQLVGLEGQLCPCLKKRHNFTCFQESHCPLDWFKT